MIRGIGSKFIMGHGLGKLTPSMLYIEILFSIIIIIACYYIYKKTKEIYELTDHKGIEYFRKSFLFFGAGHILRFMIQIFSMLHRDFNIFPFGPYGMRFFLMIVGSIMGYVSIMAIICLTYSLIWKYMKIKKYDLIILNFIALLPIPLIIFLDYSIILIPFQLLFILFVGILALVVNSIKRRKRKKKNHFLKLYSAYMLLYIFWGFNIAGIIVRFHPVINHIFRSLSIILFLFIAYKVGKATNLNSRSSKKK